MNQANSQNAAAQNQTSQVNARTSNQYGQNQFNNAMQGAGQLGNLSNLGFNMGNTITNQQSQQGATTRAINQAILDAAQGQWQGYTNAGNLGLGQLQSGVDVAPSNAGSTSKSVNPGLAGIISLLSGF